MVVPGCRATVAAVTNRPVMAERPTARVVPPERLTVSVVVVRGLRLAVEAFTNRPVRTLRLTVLPKMGSNLGAASQRASPIENTAVRALESES